MTGSYGAQMDDWSGSLTRKCTRYGARSNQYHREFRHCSKYCDLSMFYWQKESLNVGRLMKNQGKGSKVSKVGVVSDAGATRPKFG